MKDDIKRIFNFEYFLILLALLLWLLFGSELKAQLTWTGSGTQADPWIIDTYTELQDLESKIGVGGYTIDGGHFFELGADINCTWDEDGSYWLTVDGTGTQTWTNHLDGKGYTIKNLDLDRTLTVAASVDQYRGMFRTLGWKVTPSVQDTSYSVIKNITFDSTRIGGTYNGNSFNTDLIMGIICGIATGGAVDVNNTPLADNIVIRNTQYRSFVQTKFTMACWGEAIGIVSTDAYVRRIYVESDITWSRDGTSNDYTSSYRSNSAGGLFGATYTNSVVEECAFVGTMNIHEGTGTGGANGIISIGGIAGVAHFGQTYRNSYVQVTFNITSDVTAASQIGGLVGTCDDVSGASNNVHSYACYVAVEGLTLSSNDIFGHIFGYERFDFWTAFNTFADTTLVVSNTLGNASGVLFQGDASGSPAYGQLTSQIGKTTTFIQTQSNLELESPLTNGYPFDFTTVWTMSGYPILQWLNLVSPTLTITSPVNGTYQLFPFIVNWTGADCNYDSAYVNGVPVLLDTSFVITTGTPGNFSIVVMSYDSLAQDSIQVIAVLPGTLTLDSAKTTNNFVIYYVNYGGLEDSIDFKIGQDSLDMQLVARDYLGAGVGDTTFTFPKLDNFYSKDSTWYRISTVEDSTDEYYLGSLNFLGQIGGNLICWEAGGTAPIEVYGQLDLGCGWVNNITYKCGYHFLNVVNGSVPSYSSSYNYKTPEDRALTGDCFTPPTVEKVFIALDTLTMDVTQEKYNQTLAFISGGASVTHNNRRYSVTSAITGSVIQMEDLQNGLPKVTLFEVPEAVLPLLYLYKYSTNIIDTVKYATGNLNGGLEVLDTAKIILYDASDFNRIWTFNSISEPPLFEPVITDTYKTTVATSYKRNYFRGIHPKILKNGVL